MEKCSFPSFPYQAWSDGTAWLPESILCPLGSKTWIYMDKQDSPHIDTHSRNELSWTLSAVCPGPHPETLKRTSKKLGKATTTKHEDMTAKTIFYHFSLKQKYIYRSLIITPKCLPSEVTEVEISTRRQHQAKWL